MAAKYDAIVVGAGFAGLYMLHKLRNEMGLKAKVIEKGSEVGGTWNVNSYPGARCDVPSLEYSYSFDDKLQQEWNWSTRYATQPEILKYLSHCADRFDLRKDIQFNTTVVSAHFQADSNEWEIRTNNGEVLKADFCIMATGCLSQINVPAFKGQDQFKGELYHTANWPKSGVDFEGKKVGVIGTGSSGVQCITSIAPLTSQLYVFQRTPCFAVPAHNVPLSEADLTKHKAQYATSREKARNSVFGLEVCEQEPRKSAMEVTEEERLHMFQKWWDLGGVSMTLCYNDIAFNPAANDALAAFFHDKIRTLVKNSDTAKLLTPSYPIGMKRLVVDTGYYETFNRDNVTLVDVKDTPIKELTAKGLKVGDKEYELDVVVVATGFDAMVGALNAIDIQGVEGVALKKKWEEGPKEYLGLMASGFPNLFTITGPGSPSVISAMNVSIEQHVEFIGDLIKHMRANNLHRVDASSEAQQQWVDQVNAIANFTLIFKATNSWYVGANIEGKPRVCYPYPAGVAMYMAKVNEVVSQGYSGFNLS